MTRKVRVMVVDDSAFMRKVIGDMLASDQRFDVVARVRDGEEALQKLSEADPDVITMDVEMPRKNGLEALKEIMERRPTPVVMVSSLTKEGAEVTLQALSLGAVDFVTKPSGTISLDMHKVEEELRQKVWVASTVDRSRLKPGAVPRRKPVEAPKTSGAGLPGASQRRKLQRVDLVLIASSTGGPRALQEVIPNLRGDFPCPILVVQHMPKGFTASFAQRLDDVSPLKVVEGYDGLKPQKGMAIIAPGGYHMVVERSGPDLVCRLSDAPPVRSVKPAADMLFMSVADVVGGSVVAAVLTGMGRDGADGALALHSKGGVILAESPDTCVVYGMPRAVVEAGIAEEVVSLYDMPEALHRWAACP
ncbi:chemotaxis response regulator containing a CheY-like receiver domain and a methylesterase domain [Thermanaerovibrio velox DSM 12556]|uniref:Protein-glutamate methylesterase/protein-glutamine glutaminase n=1 Tax=Thermanaerovibrio velox DSM 12556 TaxID=926567 RepID=H0UPY6_9BACT|nr:chemotaxis response regulator protein-glutamate methylesterase [Thermanaerovibrio velox]EHM09615.1 chemotaxis response regulator containing a CheY-like receiver domain and a methylesterase domain [Thermanaerovibrio velox DSM 12556]